MNENLLQALGEYQQTFGISLAYNLRFLKDGVDDEYASFIREHIESGHRMTEDEEKDARFFEMPPEGSLW